MAAYKEFLEGTQLPPTTTRIIALAVALVAQAMIAIGVWGGEFFFVSAVASRCEPSGKGLMASLAFILGCTLYVVALKTAGFSTHLQVAMIGRIIGLSTAIGALFVLVAYLEGYLPLSATC